MHATCCAAETRSYKQQQQQQQPKEGSCTCNRKLLCCPIGRGVLQATDAAAEPLSCKQQQHAASAVLPSAGAFALLAASKQVPEHGVAVLLSCISLPQAVGVGDGSLAAVACAGVPHRVERENIKDFLAKKRETFLVQVCWGCQLAGCRGEHDTCTCVQQHQFV